MTQRDEDYKRHVLQESIRVTT